MKKSLFKNICLSLACLLGIGGLIGVALSSPKEATQVSAASTYYTEKKTYLYLFNPETNKGATTFQEVNNTGTWKVSPRGADDGQSNYSLWRDIPSSQTITFTRNQSLKHIYEIDIYIQQFYGKVDKDWHPVKGTLKIGGSVVATAQSDGSDSSSSIFKNKLAYKGDEKDGVVSLDLNAVNSSSYSFYFNEIFIYYREYSAINVTLNHNGGTSTQNSVACTYGEAMPASVKVPTRHGYRFDGYYVGTKQYYKADGTKAVDKFDINAESATFTAKWTLMQFDITLDDNEGTGGQGSIKAIYGDPMPNLTTLPTRTGYTFQGYFDAKSGGTQYFDADGKGIGTYNLTKATTVYARWEANKYTVSLIDNYPSGTTEYVTATYVEVMPTLESLPTRGGYDFIGFFDDATAGTQYYNADGTPFEDKIYNLTTDLSLYAHWDFNGQKLMDLIDSIGEITYPTSREVLMQVEFTYYQTLDSVDREAFATEHPEYVQKLVEAREVYDAQAADAVEVVKNAIDGIVRDGEGKVLYPSSQASIEEARSLYDALAPEEKAPSTAVTNYNDLTQAESDYSALRSNAISETIAAIDAISKPFDENREFQISNAQNLYDALAEDDKTDAIITNYFRLVDAHAADDVCDAIEALPAVIDTDEYRALVSGAREQYEALSDNQEAFVPRTSDIYSSLVEKEEALKVIKAINDIGEVSYPDSEAKILAAKAAYDAYKDNGYNLEYIVNYDVLEKALDDYYNADSVAKLIEAIPAPADSQEYYDAVDAARAAYYALAEDEQQLLKDSIFDPATSMSYADYLLNQGLARDVIGKIDDIDNVTYNGGENDSLEDIEAAETAYNAIKDNEYVKGIVDSINYQTLVDDRITYDHVDTVADLISGLNASESEEYYNAVDLANFAYDLLSDAEQAIIDAATNINYEKVLEDHKAAREVIEIIGNIGTLTYDGGANDSLSDIEAAEAAYNTIKDNADVKAIVDSVNHQTLVDDRESYDEVHHTVTLIQDIGEIKNDEETKEDLEEAWAAYNALSEDEKALVKGYENCEKVLIDDQKVYEVLVLIDDIGAVSYDSRSEDAISEARAAYDLLSEDQKEQLGQAKLDELKTAENALATLKKNNNILLILLLIAACLTLVGGVWFLIVLLKKKKNNNDDHNGNSGSSKKEPVKAMSIGGILPLAILTSNYFSGPWIALYAIAGLAVLLWISILVIVIMKKKQVGPFKKKVEVAKAEPQATIQNEDEEVETISDEEGNIFQIRYIKSFTAKLIQSPEKTKKYYEELKNEVLSYKKTNSRISWHFDSVNAGRNYVLKFAIRGKTLCVYLPLNADDYSDSKYKVEKVESKKFEDVPCLYRIKNDRRVGYAKELIAVVANNLKLEKGQEQHEVYSNLPYEANKPLIERGLIKELKVQVNKPQEEVLASKINSDGDEVITTKDSKGNIFEIRYIKSFTAKLSQAEDVTKDYYHVLKNYVLSYKKANSRVSWHYDSINVGRELILKFAIRGKTLCLYYALDASALDDKYKVEEAKGKKFIDVPCLYRIKNDRRCEYAKELIDLLMEKLGVEKGKELNDEYRIPFEDNKTLLAKGLIKEVKRKVTNKEEVIKAISVIEADEKMSDEEAEKEITEDLNSKEHKGKKGIINIDTIGENFNDGDVVTIEALWEKKLIPHNVGYVKVLARGTLSKKLTLDLQDYSIQAVKMVLLEGGTVKKSK